LGLRANRGPRRGQELAADGWVGAESQRCTWLASGQSQSCATDTRNEHHSPVSARATACFLTQEHSAWLTTVSSLLVGYLSPVGLSAALSLPCPRCPGPFGSFFRFSWSVASAHWLLGAGARWLLSCLLTLALSALSALPAYEPTAHKPSAARSVHFLGQLSSACRHSSHPPDGAAALPATAAALRARCASA